MLKSIKVTNHLDNTITLELRKPNSSGFFVLGVDGLNPSKATINTTELVASDGAVYNSARTSLRNIIFTLAYNDVTLSIEELRQLTYTLFPVKSQVTMEFETDSKTTKIIGYVESNDISLFTTRQASVISIICPSPYFSALESDVTIFSGTNALFQFPFSNESLTIPLIDFGGISISTEKSVYYDGDAQVGINIHIHLLGAVEDLTIYSLRTRQTMVLDTDIIATLTGGSLTAGDDIYISTIKGDKYIYHMRGGVQTNILNCLSKDTDWFYLLKGDNVFTYTVTSGLENLQFRMEYTRIYEGV